MPKPVPLSREQHSPASLYLALTIPRLPTKSHQRILCFGKWTMLLPAFAFPLKSPTSLHSQLCLSFQNSSKMLQEWSSNHQLNTLIAAQFLCFLAAWLISSRDSSQSKTTCACLCWSSAQEVRGFAYFIGSFTPGSAQCLARSLDARTISWWTNWSTVDWWRKRQLQSWDPGS